MKKLEKYKDLNHTLKNMKLQVMDSLPFAMEYLPRFRDPEELFYFLKRRVKYRNDPPGTELLQSMQTLLSGDYWGIKGAGDCDCFTIATLASAITQGWDNIYIALVGRERSHPVHIYTVIYWNGQRKVLDLTNRAFNHERDSYRFIQEVPVNWRNWNPRFKK